MAQKAHLEVGDKENNTPLHLAAKEGNYTIIKLLLKAGANTKAKNNQKQKPVQVAHAAGKPNTATFIEPLKLRLDMQPIISPMQQEISRLKEKVRFLQGKPPKPRQKKQEPQKEDIGTFRRSPQDKPSRQSKEQNTCVFFKSKTPSAPTFDTISPEPTSGQLPMTLMNKTLLKLRQLLSKSALLALEKGSKKILEEELLWGLKSKSSELIKLEGLTDKTDLIANKLANSLAKHCEFTPADHGGKKIVLKNSQDTNVSLLLRNTISTELDNILKELGEQKNQPKDSENMRTL